jgi:glyceraldehyde-3-phosphate dehydrogenase/erythrose-4-phosphate dehydrogenase
MAFRVPTLNVSVVDLTCRLDQGPGADADSAYAADQGRDEGRR